MAHGGRAEGPCQSSFPHPLPVSHGKRMAGDDLACILSSVAFRVADQGLCRRFNMEVVAPALGVDSLIVRTAQASELACDKAMECLIQRCACGLSLPLICWILVGYCVVTAGFCRFNGFRRSAAI